jgi:MinD-like ATPase involved in chromosome partitioning or flagellar assembly
MGKIISIHSFRGGTGKSNTSANIASQLAVNGSRVGVIDTDINSPGIHILFGVQEHHVKHSLNDYLWGRCKISDAALNVTANIRSDNRNKTDIRGEIFLIPSSMNVGEIARILREGYDVTRLSAGYQQIIDELSLDYLVIDTHPGVNEETLLSIAISDFLAIIMRPDSQDYQGTSVTVEVARKLDVRNMMLIVNKVPSSFDLDALKSRIEATYKTPVAAVIPHSDDLMTLGSSGIFSLQTPDNLVSKKYQEIAKIIRSI